MIWELKFLKTHLEKTFFCPGCCGKSALPRLELRSRAWLTNATTKTAIILFTKRHLGVSIIFNVCLVLTSTLKLLSVVFMVLKDRDKCSCHFINKRVKSLKYNIYEYEGSHKLKSFDLVIGWLSPVQSFSALPIVCCALSRLWLWGLFDLR